MLVVVAVVAVAIAVVAPLDTTNSVQCIGAHTE